MTGSAPRWSSSSRRALPHCAARSPPGAVDGLGDVEDVLLGVKDVHDLDGVGQVLVGEVPDPGRAIAEHDAARDEIDASALEFAQHALGEERRHAVGVPQYLIAASFMAAPGGLMMAKLMVPETEEPRNDIADLDEGRPVNIFDAAASGAMLGLRIAAAVGAMLIAIIGLIALLNGLIGWLGGFVGAPDLTFQQLIGWLFMPVAWIIGVPWAEAAEAGSFIGQKLVLNEFVAYLDFAPHIPELSEGTVVIVTFALCGFANFGSVAILLGGLSAIAPNRREDIARFGMRALIAGTLANLMSASLAGIFFWL